MRLVCNGVALDLKSGATLSFKKVNPLFAFADLTCERTQSFQIPSTPNNERIFGLAKIPAFRGEGMRRRFDCELQDGTVVKRGHLYVDKYSKDEYSAVFVTGELLGLQAVRDVGSVDKLLQYDEAFQWTPRNVKDANASDIADFDLVRYEVAQDATISPSVSIRKIVTDAFAKLGVPIVLPSSSVVDRLRMFKAGGLKVENVAIHFVNENKGGQDPVNVRSFLGIVNFANAGSWEYRAVGVPYLPYADATWEYQQALLTDQFTMPVIPYDCSVTFPDDFPSNMFLAAGDLMGNHYQLPNQNEPWTNFLGGYSFAIDGSVLGDPLAGRTVDIPANTPFLIIPKDGVVWQKPVVGETAYIGYDASKIPSYDYELMLTINHEFVEGDLTPFNAIMPSLTLLELSKMVAALTGTVLNYDGTVRFDELAFDVWSQQHITECISMDELNRRFMDYARRNVVRYSSGSSVLAGEKISLVYIIDNDNIDAEKELQTLAVSEGGRTITVVQVGDTRTVVERVLTRGDDDAPTVAMTSSTDTYMERTKLMAVEGVQKLCSESTSVVLKVRASLMDFEALTAKTIVLFRGTRYVWTEANWSKEVATLKLSAVGT